MSFVLYYSNYCENSKKLLVALTSNNKTENIHFICIDNRITERSGIINVILENGHKIILPPTVKSVPSLLLLDKGHQVVEGNEIYNILLPETKNKREEINSDEPMAFKIDTCTMTGVASDTFSFLDMSSEDLSAKGGGGLRQMHHYVTIDEVRPIETPPDDYTADKVSNEVTIDKIRAEREKDVPRRPQMNNSFY